MDTSLPETPAIPTASPPLRRLLAFTLETREFALPLDSIVEVVGSRDATPVAHPEPALVGLLPLRGRMVTLLDLRRYLDRPGRPPGSSRQIIVVDRDGDLLGLVVDAVTRVVTTSEPPAPAESGSGPGRAAPFAGSLRCGDADVVVVDLERILGGLR